MKSRQILVFGVGGLALLVAICLLYFTSRRDAPVVDNEQTVGEIYTGEVSTVIVEATPSAETFGHETVLTIRAGQVLAYVNGKELRQEDVLPPRMDQIAEQKVAAETLEYFRDRAVNRELVLQAAASHHLNLDASQQHQLAQLKLDRKPSGPGLVQSLNLNERRVDHELRDAEAFMLQTSLLAAQGSSPDVSAKAVLEYYEQHRGEFPALPVDEESRVAAWENIDVQIREKLAHATRSAFNAQLTAYMNRLKSDADIRLTPLEELSMANERPSGDSGIH